MARNGLSCADVPLRNYSLAHSPCCVGWDWKCVYIARIQCQLCRGVRLNTLGVFKKYAMLIIMEPWNALSALPDSYWYSSCNITTQYKIKQLTSIPVSGILTQKVKWNWKEKQHSLKVIQANHIKYSKHCLFIVCNKNDMCGFISKQWLSLNRKTSICEDLAWIHNAPTFITWFQ